MQTQCPSAFLEQLFQKYEAISTAFLMFRTSDFVDIRIINIFALLMNYFALSFRSSLQEFWDTSVQKMT